MILTVVSLASPVKAAVSAGDLRNSIVRIEVFDGRDVIRVGSGFVVQGDRFNGYIVTNAELVSDADSLTVQVPTTGAQLVAQVLRTNLSADYALLKVNGLDLPALIFARNEPISGEVVWSAAKLGDSDKVTLNKGLLRNGFKLSREEPGWYQHTAALGVRHGGALLNDCGEILGLNFTHGASDGSVRALDHPSLRKFLRNQNVKMTDASGVCVSEVVKAREKAELARAEAQRAKDEAEKAQSVARNLEKQLKASKRSGDDLIRQTRIARERAESAIRAAELAEAKAENTRRELEEKTTVLREETQELLKVFEEDRKLAEARFQDLLASQQEAAESRERILIGLSIALVIIIAVVVFLARVRFSGGRMVGRESGTRIGDTKIHRQELAEYVLDGRDDDGIRYLLRISGDQLGNDDGVIIGRNPKDSPYIINHADVSRKHARIRVMKNRVFIEDLGSTNGTSVNGQSIDDKGLVSVSSGDQIIIGSVVMKLRVMEG
ncbi:MAG: FHA domain-containing protein [Gammaproteobacteria bacterium]|jgi:hypothetical protein|nr:FHA domain-containing protein [Gammaproteobacteria bacterium]MBT7369970.1 FHA domain-containing protein [Gammaproteobacteria bacterium]